MHTTPYLNYTPMTSASNRFSLDNLNDLNSFGDHVYLTSNDDPADPPPWLRGDRNIPTKPDLTSDGEESGLSSAPALILWTEKEGGIVDAFYFYFYSFNLGNTVAGWRFGNHVGDWGERSNGSENGPVLTGMRRTYGCKVCERRAAEHVFQRAQRRGRLRVLCR